MKVISTSWMHNKEGKFNFALILHETYSLPPPSLLLSNVNIFKTLGLNYVTIILNII